MLNMNIEQMREICMDLRNTQYEWKQFVSRMEDILFVERQENPFSELQELSCSVDRLRHHCSSISKMITVMEKCIEEYSFAEKTATNLLQQKPFLCRDTEVKMNDLTAIGKQMKSFNINTLE